MQGKIIVYFSPQHELFSLFYYNSTPSWRVDNKKRQIFTKWLEERVLNVIVVPHILSPSLHGHWSYWDDKYNPIEMLYHHLIYISSLLPSLRSCINPSNILEEKSLALIFLYTWNAKGHWKIAFFSRKGFKAEELFILTTKPCILSHFSYPSNIDENLNENISFLISSIGVLGFL